MRLTIVSLSRDRGKQKLSKKSTLPSGVLRAGVGASTIATSMIGCLAIDTIMRHSANFEPESVLSPTCAIDLNGNITN